MSETTMIPLNKLVEDKANVRTIGKKDGIGQLAASIKAQGLLQSLVVKEADKGKYAVCAGGRRLRALRLLAKNGDIDKAMPIACRIIGAEQAAEASLAENIVRTNMHPADEIEAFARLCEAGEGPEAIGARFGVNGVHVARRLKLARVSPKLLEAFRRDELDLDQLSALAFSDDHAAQEAAFFGAPEWSRTPERLKAQLAQAHVAETDKLARFVGIEDYVAVGGTLASDLFAEDDETRFLSDRDLLVRLAESKLAAAADQARAEGWAWVEIAIDGPVWTQFPERVRDQRRPLDDAQQAEQERLYEALDATEDENEIERIEAAIDALSPSSWNAEEVKLAGVVISLSHAGEIKFDRGLVKLEDVKGLKALRHVAKAPSDNDEGGDGGAVGAPEKPALPAKLVDELLAHKTLALRVELQSNPDLALRLLAFTFAADLAELHSASCLDVKVTREDVTRSIIRSETKAPGAYEELADAWRSRLPGDPGALWSFIADADQATLLELIALAIAPGIDLRRCGSWSGMEQRLALGEALCSAANLDMTKWWTASVESYFEHVRKDQLIEGLLELNPKLDVTALTKSSKKELLARAKRAFKGSHWLPIPLRVIGPVEVSSVSIAAE